MLPLSLSSNASHYQRLPFSSGRAVMALMMGMAISSSYAGDDKNETKPVEFPSIVITTTPLPDRYEANRQPVSVLQGEELRRKRDVGLGDTLSQELGITSSSFGAGASRPIIRGLDGPRVQILDNGIGAMDLSDMSPDHAVSAESLNTSRIEVLRGPSTLLYGSGVSGGIVNVVSRRIPDRLYQSVRGSIESRLNSATKQRTGALELNGSLGRFSMHLDTFGRKTGDYNIPGHANKNDPFDKKGTVRNSATESFGAGAGGSYIGDNGFIGGSFSRLENQYGIPGPDGASIALRQNRYNLAGELHQPLYGLEKMKVQAGFNDYRHNEIESTGEIATRFKNQELEGRTELLHSPVANWQGTLGAQFRYRRVSALGEEAIIPETRSTATGIFLVEERNWDSWRIGLGGRVEFATQDPRNNTNPSRSFALYNASASTTWKLADGYKLEATGTHGQRAPAIQELYINGIHHGSGTFQAGSPSLRKEISNNLDISFFKNEGLVRWKINFFHNWIKDYIFMRSTDTDNNGIADRVDETGTLDPAGEFLVQNLSQTNARFYGAEAEVMFPLFSKALDVRLFTDYVRGRLGGNNGGVPRTTPLRFGLGLTYKRGPWLADLNTFHIMQQNSVAALETRTSGYTMVNLELSYRFAESKSEGHRIFLQGKNLLGEQARVHTSFLKDYAPLPGHAFVIGYRGDF